MTQDTASIDQYFKELVSARLETLSPTVGIAVGDKGEFTRDELLRHVEVEDEIGRLFVEIDIEFLRALKEGTLFA